MRCVLTQGTRDQQNTVGWRQVIEHGRFLESTVDTAPLSRTSLMDIIRGLFTHQYHIHLQVAL